MQLSPSEITALLTVMGLFVLTIGLIDITLVIVWKLRQPAVEDGTAPPVFAPKWSVVDVWWSWQIILAALIALSIPGMFIVGILSPSLMDQDAMMKSPAMQVFMVWITWVQMGLLAFVPFCYIWFRYRMPLAAAGIHWPKRQEVVQGVVWGLGVMGVAYITQLLLHVMLGGVEGVGGGNSWLDRAQKELSNEKFIKEMTYPLAAVGMFIAAGILAPICEEIYFRGFLFNALRHRFGDGLGVFLSAAGFAVVHMAPLHIIAIFPMGVLLALAYRKTKSLAVPIIMHATNNCLAVLMLLIELWSKG